MNGVETSVDCTHTPGLSVVYGLGTTATRVVRFINGFGAGVHYGVHNSSIKNLCRAIAERVLYTRTEGVLLPPIRPSQFAFAKLTAIKNKLLKKLSPTPVCTPMEYPDMFTGRKKVIYEQAVATLIARGVSLRDSFVSAFVKAEKIDFTAKPDAVPRVIQPRCAVYTVALGCYLKLFEGRLCRGFKSCFGYNVIVKGLNAQGVALQLRSNWDTFKKPFAVMIDATRFDQHVSSAALKFEHSVYNSVFRCPYLERLLKMQLVNRGYGRTTCGSVVKYKVDGCRMSGDINTGMGNCLIMSLMILGYCESVGHNVRLTNNGDDCVIIMEDSDKWKMQGLQAYCLDLGFKLSMDGEASVFEHIKFCQTQPILTGSGWRMVRNIHTAPSKDLVSLLSIANQQEFDVWRTAIGKCGLELTRGVPMWEHFYKCLIASDVAIATGVQERIMDSGMGYLSKGVEGCSITDDARFSFWLATGIMPDDQIAYEQTPMSYQYAEPEPLMFSDITSEFIGHYGSFTR